MWFNDLLYLGFTAVLLVTAYLVLTGEGSSFRPLVGALVLLPAALIASGLLRALWSLRHRTGIGVRRALLALLNWLSLSWTVAMASLQALVRSKAVFMRTPKERERQSLWTAIRDAKVETLLAILLWGAGIATAFTGRATVLLVGLFAWQGLVYASAPLMSWLNVRTVLTPQLERRRRTELRRERAAALIPYYAAGGVAVAAVALVAAILALGGADPGRAPGGLRVPRAPDPPGIIEIVPNLDDGDGTLRPRPPRVTRRPPSRRPPVRLRSRRPVSHRPDSARVGSCLGGADLGSAARPDVVALLAVITELPEEAWMSGQEDIAVQEVQEAGFESMPPGRGPQNANRFLLVRGDPLPVTVVRHGPRAG